MIYGNKIIYLDQAATSFPKAPYVIEAISNFLINIGANPGRSGHRLSLEAARIIYETRSLIAQLINCPDPKQIIFTQNATAALNYVIFKFLDKNDEVATTSMEHNSVMRPLRYLEKYKNTKIKIVKASNNGLIDVNQFCNAVSKKTRLIIINHVSNVTGTIQPLEEICSKINDIPILVDAAQSIGCLPIDVQKLNVAFLAFSGHKGLLGPHGTGCLFIRSDIELEPMFKGGTGSNSESIEQPDFMPDKFESGTMNACGLAGLGASVKWILDKGIDTISKIETQHALTIYNALSKIPHIKIYGLQSDKNRLPIFSFSTDNIPIHEVGRLLDRKYKIMVRVGLQCAPEAHKTIGTFPTGTIRLSAGCMNTTDEIDYAAYAINEIITK